MIVFNMRNLSTKFTVLCLTATVSTFTLAYADNSYAPAENSYSASQSLPGLSPGQVAAEVEARFDPLTGRTEYIAKDFDPFEGDTSIAGSALLRSASTGISRDGLNVSGGAYLDVSVMYTAASRDPYDSKGVEHAVFMNGEPVNVMTYDVQTLDCTRDITRVTYDDGYYSGASYGYVGGVYRHYPRYRGHNHYRGHRDRIRYGDWRGNRHNFHGYHGYDSRHSYGSRHRGHVRGNRGNSIADRLARDVATQVRDGRGSQTDNTTITDRPRSPENVITG